MNVLLSFIKTDWHFSVSMLAKLNIIVVQRERRWREKESKWKTRKGKREKRKDGKREREVGKEGKGMKHKEIKIDKIWKKKKEKKYKER